MDDFYKILYLYLLDTSLDISPSVIAPALDTSQPIFALNETLK